MSQKNIIFFTHNLDSGGAEKAVRKVAKYIDDNYADYKVYVCVVYDAPLRHSEVNNLIVLKTKSQPSDNKLVKGINVLRQISEMKSIKRSLNAKVCVSFLTGADMINVLSGVGEKKVISVRTKESRFTHDILRKWYIQFTYALCDRIVTVTDVPISPRR